MATLGPCLLAALARPAGLAVFGRISISALGTSKRTKSPVLASLFKQRLHRSISSSAVVYSNHSPDYYTVLGINKSATTEQVKMAYFKRVRNIIFLKKLEVNSQK